MSKSIQIGFKIKDFGTLCQLAITFIHKINKFLQVRGVDSWPKMLLTLYPSFGNLKTQIAAFYLSAVELLKREDQGGPNRPKQQRNIAIINKKAYKTAK